MRCIGTTTSTRVFHGNALEFLEDEVLDTPDLVFMDPPFNIGEPYDGCDDDLPLRDYRNMLDEWIRCAIGTLGHRSSLWIHLPDEHITFAVQSCQDYGMKMENWCIWHYRFAQCNRSRFLRSKVHSVWFSKGNPTVNVDAALVPSDRAAIYDDARIYDSVNGGMRMELDVWGFDPYWGRVQGNNKERCPAHPNQLPEKYMERIIGVCSRPGSLVVDPFCGSGTTATVAEAMGRQCLTTDISLVTAESALERVQKGAVRVCQG